jgi:non-specific serine/threonine protein kinase
MSKAYSNKALPAGTVLREWRLEQVLGVGGFGIVYKGRGIYFDELVAIKEYFPSSISEREEDDTVVPIDSDAEEVHALGLKKFVEEAKLLWNLSTPTRHPNIVSVRSLFEIHGTAYMVMDFEDGMSLSKLLKDGKRWNEASLTGMFKPIAEGLDRAHRVGVLHRDIKPPNILINDDGRPVLIDFGSARFESGEATSTSVTFHTPPYAAIEQYVKTYDQGPWTDVYALGVVLYQCITGDKPPEVLERMHGGLGKPLAAGDWPGYSKKFLAAVDAAMIVKPTERPQSIPKWLAMFDGPDMPVAVSTPEPEIEDDSDATVVGTFEPAEEIVPVAPPPPGFIAPDKVETAVPTDPNDVKFKRAGEDTQSGKKIAEPVAEAAPEELVSPLKTKGKKGKEEALPPPAPEPEAAPEPEPMPEVVAAPVKKDIPPAKPGDTSGEKKKLSPALLGGVAAAVLVLGVGGWYMTRGGDEASVDEALTAEAGVVAEPIDIEASGGIAPAVKALADEAAGARASAAAQKVLTDAATQLATMDEGLKRMAADPAQANAVKARQDEMGKLAMKAASDFAAVLLREADGRVSRLARDLPWADPRRANAAASESAAHQAAARQVRLSLSALRAAAGEAGTATDAAAALIAAQQALAQSRAYGSAVARAYRVQASPAAAETATTTTAAEPTATAAPVADSGAKGQADELFPAKFRTFNSIVREARGIADDVIEAGRGGEPGSDASQDARDGYRIRQANVQTARNYLQYLDTLVNSMRGDRTEREVDENISNAQETRRYLQQLRESSRASRR